MFNDLREYIDQVEKLGECRVIEGADWDLEIGAITELAARPNTPLLLFDKIKGYEPGYRVVTNMAASNRRVCLLLGLPEAESGMELVRAWRHKTKEGFKPVPPMEVKTGPVKENVLTGRDVDLLKFPAPRWNEFDGGRYIGTGCMVITRDPDEGWVNLGTYRVQIHDKTTATIDIDHGQHGAIMRQKYWDKGLPCPTAVSLGQDLTLFLAAYMKFPWGISEYDYAGWLRHKPVEIVRGETTDLPVPSTAEIVLEGEMVPPEIETRTEGPFGEFCGYYAGTAKPVAAFRVKSILYRNEPILQGNPVRRIEPMYGFGRNIISAARLWDTVAAQVPGVKGVWMIEDAGLPIPVISIEQQYAGQAKEAALAAKVATRGLVGRFIIVVDDDIDPSNISEVIWALGTRCDPATSIDIIKEVHTTMRDPLILPEKRRLNEFTTSSALIMACKPYHWIKEFPRTNQSSSELLEKTKDKWGKLIE